MSGSAFTWKQLQVYYTIEYKIIIQLEEEKKNNKVLNVLRDCSRWLWANTCPFSSKHMRFLLTLVIFPWRILGMLPYSLFLLLSVVQIYVSGHYIFRFILLLASIPSPHRQIQGHLFSSEPGELKRYLMPDSLHPAVTKAPSLVLREKVPLGPVSRLCAPAEGYQTNIPLARQGGVGTMGDPVFQGSP